MTAATSLTVGWREGAADFEAVRCVPARLAWDDGDLLVATDESVVVRSGLVEITAEIPGFQPLSLLARLPAEAGMHLVLDPDQLIPAPATDETVAGPARLVTATRHQPALHGASTLAITAGGGRQSIRAPRPVRLEIFSPVTPRRMLFLPPIGDGEINRLAWHQPDASVRRPRIEPTDPGGALLMAYLLSGRFELAAAAARAVERIRGEIRTRDWAAVSYTQLLIGYAYALGGDVERLLAWCRRTAATSELGTDGMVLAAEAAWQMSNYRRAARLLAGAERLGPPTLTYGGELGIRLANLLIARRPTDHPDANVADFRAALVRLTNTWLPLLTRTDPYAVHLSIPETPTMSPDLSESPWTTRIRWLTRYAVSRLCHPRLAATPTSIPISSTPQEAPVTLDLIPAEVAGERTARQPRPARPGYAIAGGVGVLVILIVVATLIANTVNISPQAWTLFGALEAMTLLAVGAYVGSTVYRVRADEADRRADEAESRAEHYQESAMKFRALMAVLEADARTADNHSDEAGEILRRHADIAERLDFDDRRRARA